MLWGLKIDQWLTVVSVAAILFSPLIALEIQKRLDDRRDHTVRKLEIFRTLMKTRASTMNPSHVEALSSIEIEFYATRGPDKRVLDAWRLYAAHLNQKRKLAGDELARWADEKQRLLVELLYDMAQTLGFPEISRDTIKNVTYYPQGFVDVEAELHALRRSALEVFAGQRPIFTNMVGAVQVVPQIDLSPDPKDRGGVCAPSAVSQSALPPQPPA